MPQSPQGIQIAAEAAEVPLTSGLCGKFSSLSKFATTPPQSPQIKSMPAPDLERDRYGDSPRKASKESLTESFAAQSPALSCVSTAPDVPDVLEWTGDAKVAALLLPGLKREYKNAAYAERQHLSKEIAMLEMKLGVKADAPNPQAWLVSPKNSPTVTLPKHDDADDAKPRMSRYSAAMLLPGLRRMRMGAPKEEREQLIKEIAVLEAILGIDSGRPEPDKFKVSHRYSEFPRDEIRSEDGPEPYVMKKLSRRFSM